MTKLSGREAFMAQHRGRVIAGCRAYADATRSDPFAADRAISHHINGISGTRSIDSPMVKGLKAGDSAEYTAKPYRARGTTIMSLAFVRAGVNRNPYVEITRHKNISVV